FAMRVNRVKIGGPGEEELLAEFCTYGETDGHSIWPFGVAVDKHDTVYVTEGGPTTASAFVPPGKFIRKWGTPGGGRVELRNPAGTTADAGGNVMAADSGTDRLQVFTPDGKALTQCGRNGNGEGEFNKPWGITLDNEGNIYVADWKNHRVQKLSPSGEFMMSIGKYGTLPVPEN